MKYYKYLDIDSSKVDIFLKNYCKDFNNFSSFWNFVNTEELLKECPDLQGFFKPLGITIKNIVIIASNSMSTTGGIHKDYTEDKVRINLPIYNCEHSVTNFYKSNVEPTVKKLDNGVPYYFIDRKDCVLVESFCLTKPAVINVQELHQVVVTRPNCTRISCTISFYENIEYLLEH